jgi:hypothetical protein
MLIGRSTQPLLTVLNVIALIVVAILGVKQLALPMIAKHVYKSEYKELMFKCDDAMRDHLIAKSRVVASPSPEAIRGLHAAEVGLMTCHDYDVLRKKLLGYGLSENDLSTIGLEAIEEKAKDVRYFVETHEIRY